MAAAITVAAALSAAEQRLRVAAIPGARHEAVALLGHVLNRSRAALLADQRGALAQEDQRTFDALVRQRAANRPLQYLLGRAEFLDFQVRVGPGVFIPRPETEQLVLESLAAWPRQNRRAVDLCTGNGAIAIALARARPDARILAIDISATALEWARTSASDLGVGDRIDFVRGDLLSGIATLAAAGVLVCNPPYAALDDVVQPEVRDHEPQLAWAGGPAGTEVFERLIPQAADLLASDCPMLLELGYDQARSVSEMLVADGRWSAARTTPDFQGIPRVLRTSRS